MFCRVWKVPRRGKAWKNWDSSQQVTLFEPLPVELRAPSALEGRLPQPWTPPARPCKSLFFNRIAPFSKAHSPVTKRSPNKRKETPAQRKARKDKERKDFAEKERSFAASHQVKPATWSDLKAKASMAPKAGCWVLILLLRLQCMSSRTTVNT